MGSLLIPNRSLGSIVLAGIEPDVEDDDSSDLFKLLDEIDFFLARFLLMTSARC